MPTKMSIKNLKVLDDFTHDLNFFTVEFCINFNLSFTATKFIIIANRKNRFFWIKTANIYPIKSLQYL